MRDDSGTSSRHATVIAGVLHKLLILEDLDEAEIVAAKRALNDLVEQNEALRGALETLMSQMERGTKGVRDDEWYAARDVARLALDSNPSSEPQELDQVQSLQEQLEAAQTLVARLTAEAAWGADILEDAERTQRERDDLRLTVMRQKDRIAHLEAEVLVWINRLDDLAHEWHEAEAAASNPASRSGP